MNFTTIKRNAITIDAPKPLTFVSSKTINNTNHGKSTLYRCGNFNYRLGNRIYRLSRWRAYPSIAGNCDYSRAVAGN